MENEYRRPGPGVLRENSKGYETDHADDMISKYLKKASSCIDLDGAVTKVEMANQYLKNAEEALNDFNRVEDTDTSTKSMILAVGMFNAYKAFYYCKWCMGQYNRKGQKLEFSKDSSENDKIIEQYEKLSGELSVLSLNGWLETKLKVLTGGQTYTDHHHASDYNNGYDYRDTAITQYGLKIYHLKMTIDYCYAFIRCLNKYHNNSDAVDQINEYLKKAEGKLHSLNIYINDNCATHPEEMTNEIKHQLCVRCINLLDDYFNAVILNLDSNTAVDSMQFEDKLSIVMVSNKIQDKFTRIVAEENNNIELIYNYSKYNTDIPIEIDPRRLLGIVDSCIEIGNSIREYVTKLIIDKMK